jgi:hypothetical protein
MSGEEPDTQKYVYGVLRAGADPGVQSEGIGDPGGAVHTIESGPVAALVSDVAAEGPVEAGREDLMRHSRVLQEAAERTVVLPMRFGVLMPDEDTVRDELLDPHREDLEGQLAEMEGKAELTLKAFYDEEVVLREIVQENAEIGQLSEAVRDKPQDATYFERLRLGEMVAQALEAKRAADAELILAQLEPLALEVEAGEPAHERMVVNAAFLVDRERLEDFDRAAQEVNDRLGERMTFKYVGPLPPHSFVTMGSEGSWA